MVHARALSLGENRVHVLCVLCVLGVCPALPWLCEVCSRCLCYVNVSQCWKMDAACGHVQCLGRMWSAQVHVVCVYLCVQSVSCKLKIWCALCTRGLCLWTVSHVHVWGECSCCASKCLCCMWLVCVCVCVYARAYAWHPFIRLLSWSELHPPFSPTPSPCPSSWCSRWIVISWSDIFISSKYPIAHIQLSNHRNGPPRHRLRHSLHRPGELTSPLPVSHWK
jgi:hypothetical protein